MKKYHSGAGKSHHYSDFFAVVRPVTVDSTILARRFSIAEFAMFKTSIGVVLQQLAFLTQRPALSMIETAIYTQHFCNYLFLTIIHRFTLRFALKFKINC
jgi:hypothetical protein